MELCPASNISYPEFLGDEVSWHSSDVFPLGSGLAESRGFGPKCPCCGERNMQRMGYSLYRCQHSGNPYLLIVDADPDLPGYRMTPPVGWRDVEVAR
jgi:hypothetical protein